MRFASPVRARMAAAFTPNSEYHKTMRDPAVSDTVKDTMTESRIILRIAGLICIFMVSIVVCVGVVSPHNKTQDRIEDQQCLDKGGSLIDGNCIVPGGGTK